MDIELRGYTVSLRDYPGQKMVAETRYAQVLERQCGGPTGIIETLLTLQRLEDAPPEEASTEELAAMRQSRHGGTLGGVSRARRIRDGLLRGPHHLNGMPRRSQPHRAVMPNT